MKNILEQKVYYADTDAYGVVWHGSYLRWLEMGRMNFADEMGVSLPVLQLNDVVLPVTNINVRYKSSAKLNDELIIETSIQKFNPLSVSFKQKVIDKMSGKIFVEAVVDVVAISNAGKLYRKMPQILLDAFKNAIEDKEYAIK